MIEEAGMTLISEKCRIGTELMIDLFDLWLEPLGFELHTPRDVDYRGGHISIVHPDAELISIALREKKKVIPDYRLPNAIRLAISPLATSYSEVYEGFARIRDLVKSGEYTDVALPNSGVR